MVALKVCGITRAEDLEVCEALGVDAVGINLWSGSPRGLGLERARRLAHAVPARGVTKRVGVFVDASPAEVLEATRQLSLDLVQLHGDGPPEPYAALGIPWIWVVRGTPELSTLSIPEPGPAWVLLDAQVPGYGGGGVRTDWSWARRAVEYLSALPVWLAGGIRPDNVMQAIDAVNPAGVDVASGAEASPGIKDADALRKLLAACRSR